MSQKLNESGFTLIELLVVIIIIILLFALSTINLGSSVNNASLSTTTNTLLADIKSQQILAMSGGGSGQSSFGLYFQANSYTLFSGNNFSISDPNNYVVNLNGVSITNNLPSSQLDFQPGDGSVGGFISGDNTITLSSMTTSKHISVNRFGAITIN
jgi:prepilin-type N-terminal cleavage/methylation domain-containing protein